MLWKQDGRDARPRVDRCSAGILPAVLRAFRPQRGGRDARRTAAGTAALLVELRSVRVGRFPVRDSVLRKTDEATR